MKIETHGLFVATALCSSFAVYCLKSYREDDKTKSTWHFVRCVPFCRFAYPKKIAYCCSLLIFYGMSLSNGLSLTSACG